MALKCFFKRYNTLINKKLCILSVNWICDMLLCNYSPQNGVRILLQKKTENTFDIN